MVTRLLTGVSVLALASSLGLLWAGVRGPEPRDGPRARLSEGTAFLAEEKWSDAVAPLRLALATDDPEGRLVAHHNLGLALLHLALEEDGARATSWAIEAVGHQEKALEIRPGLKPSAWNLELALRRLQTLDLTGGGLEEEESTRLLASFRLQEEEALGETIRQGLRSLETPGSTARRKGPPW